MNEMRRENDEEILCVSLFYLAKDLSFREDAGFSRQKRDADVTSKRSSDLLVNLPV